METEVSRLLARYEERTMTRRDLVAALAGLAALAGASASATEESSTFGATGLDHIALRVTDVRRSADFYVEHLGLRVTSESRSSAFLDCGDNFVALFRSAEPGLHHYCYAIPEYSQRDAAERLRSVGIEPELQENRIYFPDPDGILVQLAQA